MLKSNKGSVCVIANFDVIPVSATVKFGKTGKWQKYFTKEEINLSTTEQVIELKPGEYRVYMSK